MTRRIAIPLVILGVGALGVAVLVATRPAVRPQAPADVAPLVRVVPVTPRPFTFVVRTQGTVEPRTESDLVPQVAGEVVWVSPNLVSGGFFAEDEPLLRIDPADAEVELRSARAAVARTQSEFERARTERTRQRKLREQGVASQARIDDAENAARVSEAALKEARARLARAERDVQRTELRAPYEGRVRSESVDVGQFVSRGQTVASLYAVDYAEVPLPVPDRELQYIDVSLSRLRNDADGAGPQVKLHAEFAGREHTWTGRIVRTEGEIDPRTRMLNLVARVEDPYGLHGDDGSPPLAVGLFVEAEIGGRAAEDVFVIPREALRPADAGEPDRVLVIGPDGRLQVRPVQVLRSERAEVVIGGGLASGEYVTVSPLQAFAEGMRVRMVGPDGAPVPVGETAEADADEADAPDGSDSSDGAAAAPLAVGAAEERS